MKRSTLLYLYVFVLICTPNGIGFTFGIDLRIWMLLAIILLFPSFVRLNMERKIRYTAFDLVIVFYVLALSISDYILWGGVTGAGAMVKGMLYIFMPYFAGKYFIQDERDFTGLVYAINLAAFVVVIMVFVDFYSQGNVQVFPDWLMIDPEVDWANSAMRYTRSDVFRAAATFVHPIWLGIFLLWVVLIDLQMFVSGLLAHSHRVKVLFYGSIALSIIATMFSQSRTAMVSFVATLGLMSLGKRSILKPAGLVLIFVVIITTCVTIQNFYPNYYDKFVYHNITSKRAAGNVIGRYETAVGAVEVISEYPGFFSEARADNIAVERFILFHDLTVGVLNKAITKGLVPAFLYCMILFWGIKRSYENHKMSAYGSVLFASILYFVIADIGTTLRFQTNILFFLTLGVVVNPYLWMRRKG